MQKLILVEIIQHTKLWWNRSESF